MTDPRHSSQEGLVPASSSALATRSSGLVRRGVDLLADQQHIQRKVRVLIGNSQKDISDILIETIDYAGGGQYELLVTITDQAQQLLEYVQSQEFDLCIAILNYMGYPPDYRFPSFPDWASDIAVATYCVAYTKIISKFIAEFKRVSRLPIIAMAGEGVSCSSADYYFSLPPPPTEFMEAVKTCLSVKQGSATKL